MSQPKCFFVVSLLVAFGMSLIFSCGNKTDSLPSGIFDKDKMVEVMVDVQLAEAASDNHGLSLPQMNIKMAYRYDSIFMKHHITYAQFKTSYDYYLLHPDKLADVYTEVVNKLTTMESRSRTAKKNLPAQSIKNDSL